MIWIAVALVVAALIVASVLSDTATDRAVRRLAKRRVAVTTKEGGSFVGVLAEADRRALVLTQAVTDTGETVDGQLLILRPDVAYVQIL